MSSPYAVEPDDPRYAPFDAAIKRLESLVGRLCCYRAYRRVEDCEVRFSNALATDRTDLPRVTDFWLDAATKCGFRSAGWWEPVGPDEAPGRLSFRAYFRLPAAKSE